MMRPEPSHWPHGRLTLKKPCCSRICPAPLQLGHVLTDDADLAPVPLQSPQDSQRGILSLASLPYTDSSNVTSRLYWRSLPRSALVPPRWPPKKSSKMSLKTSPKPPPRPKSNPSNPAPPCAPAWPNMSYRLRLSWSLRCSYASLTSL